MNGEQWTVNEEVTTSFLIEYREREAE